MTSFNILLHVAVLFLQTRSTHINNDKTFVISDVILLFVFKVMTSFNLRLHVAGFIFTNSLNSY
jgi:hypothetical protein